MQFDLHDTAVTLFASDGVHASLTRLKAGALRLDYEFKGAGHALIRVPVTLTLDPNYVFTFKVKGNAPANTLEFKCIDINNGSDHATSGENVWWVHRPNFKVLSRWQTLVNKKRHFTYAWGPVNAPQATVAFIELTVSASAGGKGSLHFADLVYEKLPALGAASAAVRYRASSNGTSGGPTKSTVKSGFYSPVKLPDFASAGWQSDGHEQQFLYLDFGSVREFDGLIIDFGDNFAVDYDVQVPSGKDGKRWRSVATVRGGRRKRQYHALPESEAGSMRLAFKRSARGKGYQVKAVSLEGTGFASTTSKFFARVAADLPRGYMPRYFQDEQSFWTVVGVSGGREKAIINEEGMIEPALQSPSLEPFIYVSGDEKLLTWADGEHRQSLVDGYLPMPIVDRLHPEYGLALRIETLAQGDPEHSTLYARYTVKNTGDKERNGAFYVALRHFQVNPPWQFLNTPGGFTPVNSLRVHPGCFAVSVNDKLEIFPLIPPPAYGGTRFSQGDIVEHLALGKLPHKHHTGVLAPLYTQTESVGDATAEIVIEDDQGHCSGALEYRFKLKPGQEASYVLAIPYTKQSKVMPFQWAKAEAVRYWTRTLRSVDIELPAYPELVNTIKSQLAYILINRDGAALQPGSRCYRRTWIRDGSLTSEALLQLGLKTEVKDFIEWFAPYQYENGKVPCCVDKRGADPTPEHDSHGEFIYLVVEYYRYTKDKELLRKLFPSILKAVDYIDSLRAQRLTPAYETAENRHLRGLMPESISHEGYSAKPAHSYWDDLFTLKGLEDALYAAGELGDESAEAAARKSRLATIHDAFRSDLIASMKASMFKWKIPYIPGAADLGDFDATSTTIALDPVDLSADLPEELAATFEAYWDYFQRRRQGKVSWFAYTPYEWRVVSTLARLGEIGRAHEAVSYFMNDRRPHGWNHWAEVVFKDPHTPRFIGDAPHGWVGSDFLRAVRTLFVYEKPGALVVGCGLPLEWLKDGLTIRNLATEYGTLSLSVRRTVSGLTYNLAGDISVPVELVVPDALSEGAGKRRAIIVSVGQLPATIEVQCRLP